MSVYLDNNATTRPTREVVAAMNAALTESWHNPSSIHRPGQAARQKVELARQEIARLIGTRPRFITLTGSGTEALDLAVRGALLAMGRLGGARKNAPGSIVLSPIEHPALRDLAAALAREEGVRVLWTEVDDEGVVPAESVRALLEAHADVGLVSVQWANNETGAIQPVREISGVCRERGVLYHCDATQYVGKMPVDVGSDEASRRTGDQFKGTSAEPGRLIAWSPDLLTFSPHKFHGPKGVGVLYSRAGVRTAPLIHGEQELGRRGGTENVPGIVGAAVAAKQAREWAAEPENVRKAAAVRDRFESLILTSIPRTRVNGPRDDRRLWNTSSIGFARLEAEALLMLLSERGVCCSAGAACSSGALEASPVLKAMRVPAEYAHGTLRFSISRETTIAEVEEGARIVGECVARLRKSMEAVA